MLLLEDKDQPKQRLGFSPDEAEAFALTFAQSCAAAQAPAERRLVHEYGPPGEV